MGRTRHYNGWTNYETWAVALHIDNDEGTYDIRCGAADQIIRDANYAPQVLQGIWTREETAKFLLADWTKGFAEALCGIGSDDFGIPTPSPLATDLIGAALAEVDWDEIAENWLSELVEQ